MRLFTSCCIYICAMCFVVWGKATSNALYSIPNKQRALNASANCCVNFGMTAARAHSTAPKCCSVFKCLTVVYLSVYGMNLYAA